MDVCHNWTEARWQFQLANGTAEAVSQRFRGVKFLLVRGHLHMKNSSKPWQHPKYLFCRREVFGRCWVKGDWSGWIKQHGFGGDVRGFSWFVLWLKLFDCLESFRRCGKDYLLQHVSCVLHPKLAQFCRRFVIIWGHFKMFKGSLV